MRHEPVPRTIRQWQASFEKVKPSIHFSGANGAYLKPWLFRAHRIVEMRINKIRRLEGPFDMPVSEFADSFPDSNKWLKFFAGNCKTIQVAGGEVGMLERFVFCLIFIRVGDRSCLTDINILLRQSCMG